MKYFKLPLSLLLAFTIFISCNEQATTIKQGDIAAIGMKWELVSNFTDSGYTARISLINKKEQELTDKNWAIFFSIAPSSLLQPEQPQPARLEHLNGDWYKLSPNTGFSLPAGDSIDIIYKATEARIKETDQPLGIYIVFYDGEGKEERVAKIDDYTLIPFTRREQLLRGTADQEAPASAAKTYWENASLSVLSPDQLLPVIPTPAHFSMGSGNFTLEGNAIHYTASLRNEADILSAKLKVITGKDFAVSEGNAGSKGIYLSVDPSAFKEQKAEAYRLSISENGIAITGADAAGVFYGVQSLLALIPAQVYTSKEAEVVVPFVTIDDAPRFGFRSVHLDVSRNFQEKETIFRVLDVMAQYKLNHFLLYTSEDEAWRVEIPGLPELTEVGAQRSHVSSIDAPALHPAYGSGPFAYDKGHYGSGFYTRKDFIEILEYAKKRHIKVIPELNFPGHARAAIKSMEARYQRLMKEGKEAEANEYRLIDPADKSVYLSAQLYKDNVVNVSRESTYRFFEKVVDEFAKMYEEAGLKMDVFHAGGDEVAEGAWTQSPEALELLRQHPEIKDPKNLQTYFFRELMKRMEKRNLEIHGWEEVALTKDATGKYIPNPEFANKKVVPYTWNNLFDYPDLAYQLANAGYNVVLCNVSNFYFDLAYNNDPKEPGLYWAGFIDTKNAWAFAPFNMFNTTLKSDMGRELLWDAPAAKLQSLKPEARKNIMGVEAQLWSETIKGRDMLEYYMLPKLIGFAESAWSPERKWETQSNRQLRMKSIDEEWNRFANTIAQKEFSKLAHTNGGYAYRVPPAGVIVENGQAKANVALPGISIYYTTDGSEPTQQSTLYNGPFPATGTLQFKTFDASGKAGRTVVQEGVQRQKLN
ncbi:family 20 glycosylhydrolase [Agriterribacter sp.]|uniref:family 20 glycosylhydrolase n=1 Tax=Agriterribacter sp. TaxID=2821509 RepID=UPI002B9F8B60|nr:family 20 glycosylhydrolase [Agriterribacter sp.]HRO47399.1 family 20 glycosylhydrolase [Agriterribacter sp.]HRQ16599.1 family 20 glycosylhydrolase [Agriterribacter sp.]